jgi:hypothetical protein
MATAIMGKLDNKATEPVKVNRWAIGFLLTIATLIGLTPVTFVLGRPQLLLYIIGAVTPIVGLSLIFSKFQTAATYAPSITEFLFAELYALALWALIGIVWLVAYELIFWVIRLVQFLLVLAGWHVHLNADAIAFYPTVVLAGLIIILFAIGNIEMTIDWLYPKTAGTRSAYYEGATHNRSQQLRLEGGVLLIFALISLILWFFTKQFFSIWFYIILQVYLFFVGILLPNKTDTGPSPGISNAAQAISKLLQAVGYQIISDPRTGKSDTDPLLINLDLFAYNSERAFAIEVKIAQQSADPVELSVASSLLMAAFALDKETQELGVNSQKVEPVLVLVGGEPTESLKAFCKEELIWVVPITNEDVVQQILLTDNQTDLLRFVHQYLAGISDARDAAGIPSVKPSELKGAD